MSLGYIAFDDSYRAAYRQVSRAVTHDQLVFTCGQLDADGQGVAQHLGDLKSQTRRSVELIHDIVRQAGATRDDLLHLQVFYRNDGTLEESTLREDLEALLEGTTHPIVNYTPLARFPKGVEIELDAVAAIGALMAPPVRAQCGAAQALRHRDQLFANGSTSALDEGSIERLLIDVKNAVEAVRASPEDLCRLRLYLADLASDPSACELQIHDYFESVPMVFTRLPLQVGPPFAPALRLDFCGVCATDRQTEVVQCGVPPWKLKHPQALRRGAFLFIGGQMPWGPAGELLEADDIEAQIPLVMARIQSLLAHFDAGFEHVAKVNAYYAGHMDLSTWTRNVQARCDFYPSPGPASTGVEVTTLGTSGARVSVDCLAVLDNHPRENHNDL